jgi:hypothetical protein
VHIGTGKMTAEHFLQDCLTYEQPRRKALLMSIQGVWGWPQTAFGYQLLQISAATNPSPYHITPFRCIYMFVSSSVSVCHVVSIFSFHVLFSVCDCPYFCSRRRPIGRSVACPVFVILGKTANTFLSVFFIFFTNYFIQVDV